MKKSELKQIIKEEIQKVFSENLDPLKPLNDSEKLLSPPKIGKDNKGNIITLIGQESPYIYWDKNGIRYTEIGDTLVKYEGNRYDFVEYKNRYKNTPSLPPPLDPQQIDKAWDKAYDEHTDYLKIFVKNVLEVPFNVNLGWRDGEEETDEDENIIYITSKIYGDNPTTFTTYHNKNGEFIDYEYKSYKPINLSHKEVKDALIKRKLKKLGL